MENSKSRPVIVMNGIFAKLEMIVGGLLSAFFLLILLVSLFDREEDPISFIIFVIVLNVLFDLLFYNGLKRNQMVKLYRQYAAHLSNDPMRSVQGLASSFGTPEEKVLANLDYMIRKKFFLNAYIDRARNCVVINGKQTAAAERNGMEQPADGVRQDSGSGEYVAVKCPGCGATNKVRQGAVVECEYCGGKIQ